MRHWEAGAESFATNFFNTLLKAFNSQSIVVQMKFWKKPESEIERKFIMEFVYVVDNYPHIKVWDIGSATRDVAQMIYDSDELFGE